MKIRTDFVSNSSSSSFIVLHKDNLHGLILNGRDVEHYCLKDYLCNFGRREFLGEDLWYKDKNKQMKFMTNDEFLKKFIESDGNGCYLPEDCKDEYLKLLSYANQMKNINNDKDLSDKVADKMLSTLYDAQEQLEDKILAKVKKVLDQEYMDQIFDYISVCDSQLLENDIDGNMSDEDVMMNRVQFAKQRIPDFKFFRYINNH